MTQRRLTDPLYIYADPMKGAAQGPAAPILGAAFSVFVGGTTVLGLGAFGSFLALSAIGLALNALAPKPRITQPQQRGYQVTAFGPALDHQVIYGETRIAGARVFDSSTGKNNRFLHRVIAFAGHEVEGFTEVYLNDYKLTVNLSTGEVTSAQNSEETTNRYNNRVRIIARNGIPPQQTFPVLPGLLVNYIPEMGEEIEEWTTNHRLNGIAYLYIRLRFDADVFPNGIPEITATVKGRKVFDPRTGTTAWSDNPALCLRDYLTSNRFGMGATAGEIDDVLVAQAANVCDETVEGEKRYTLNGAFTTDAAPADILQNMLTSMGGLLWHAQGAWRMKPAYYTPPVLSLTNDDLRGGLQIQTRAARRDNFNTVRGTFRGAESDWQVTDYKPVTDAAFVAADGGFETAIDLDLPFTSSHLTAQRIARIALQQQREQITVSGRFGLRAFQVQVGDTITITNSRLGWTDKEFEVVTWTFTLTDDLALEVVMTLRETSAAIYTPTAGEVFEANNTELPSPFLNVAPTNLQAVSSAFIATDGTFVNSIDVSWNAPDDDFVEFYEIEWRKTTVTEFSGSTTSATEFVIPSVDDDATYAIRVRAVNILGVRGPFTAITFNPGPDVTPPGDPTGFTAEGDLGFINLRWTNPPDRDLDYVEVWESATPSFGDASQIAESYGDTFNRGNLSPLVTRYYWIRAVDASGNKSGFVGPENGTTRQVTTGDIGPAVIQFDNFATSVTDVFDNIDIQFDNIDTQFGDIGFELDRNFDRDAALDKLSEAVIDGLIQVSDLESRVVGAGVYVEPETGRVRIQADGFRGEAQLIVDGLNAEITQRVTFADLNQAIADAVFDPSQVADLDDLFFRISTAETTLSGQEGAIENLTETLTVDGSLVTMGSVTTRLDSVEGQITNFVEVSTFDTLEERVTTAETELSAFDGAAFRTVLRDVSSLTEEVDLTAITSLEGLVDAYRDRKETKTSVAFARQDLTARAQAADEATAGLRTELGVAFDNATARIAQEASVRASADQAIATDLSILDAQVNDPDTGLPAAQASITTLEQTKVDASGAVAAVNAEIGVEFNGITGLVTKTTEVIADVDGIEARHGVTIDNNGNITGYQLLSGAAGSAFNVVADQFAVFNADGAGGDNPFTIFTSPRTVDGVVFPAGTYIRDAFIDNAAIVDLSVDRIKIATGALSDFDLLQTAVSFNGATTYGTDAFIGQHNFTLSSDANLVPERFAFRPRFSGFLPVVSSLASGSWGGFYRIRFKRDRAGTITELKTYIEPFWQFVTDGSRMTQVIYAGVRPSAVLLVTDGSYQPGDKLIFEYFWQRFRSGSVDARVEISSFDLEIERYFK